MKDVDIISKVVGRKGEAMASPSKDAATVILSGYLLKEVWEKCWEIRTTDKGEEYLFGKLPVGLQFDLSSFVDGGLIDLPTLYDGLPIDGQTLKWKEVTNEDGSVTRVLESVGGGGGTAEKVTWANIEGKPTWIGESKPIYSWSEINDRPSLNFLPLTGGTISGWLKVEDKLNIGSSIYSYILEDTGSHMMIYSGNGISLNGGYEYVDIITPRGIRVNKGGLLTYNTSGGYWEIEGNVLVNGDITSII